MASPAPAKSQPLHNFELPHLKWNKDGQSSGHHKRRRSMKSPSRRPNTSAASPLRHSPLRDSVSATPPRLQSPLRDSVAVSSRVSPVHGDYLMKQSPVRGESSKRSPNHELMKHSPVRGDSERLSLLREEALRHLNRRDSSLESETLRKGKSGLIEYSRNHSRNSAFDILKNGVYSSNSEQAEEKLEKKSKATEVDATGTKRSKILIKIPCKNNKPEEENPKEGLLKTDNNDEHGETDEVQEEGKTNNNFDEDTKIWNLRPRKPKRKSQNATVGGEKRNISGLPEKNKAQSQLKNANRSRGKEGKSGGSGGEKEEKCEKQEKMEKKEKCEKQEKMEKKEKCEKQEKSKKKEKCEKQEKIEKKEKCEKQEKIEKKENCEKQEKIEKEKKCEKKEKIEKKEKCEKQEKIETKEKGEKKEKRKLSISIALSKEEIEEDIFALTGSKPARRPKKRARNIQKQVDYAFPGLWLVSITPESYKVSENSMKG